VQGVDYLLFRADGVGVLDVYRTITAGDGRVISARVHGYVLPPAGVEMPPPPVLLAPDFRWPDAEFPIHGFALYRTGAADREELNSTVGTVEGSANSGTDVLSVTAQASLRSPLAV
jgi:hypothetical protein